MNTDSGESRRARQTAYRRSHPILRGFFIYSITCNVTFWLTLIFGGRELDYYSHPILSKMVCDIYLFSEIFLLLVSPFFIRRFGGLATLGLTVALLNLFIVSISGRT